MKDLYVRGLGDDIHLQLENIAESKGISKNELVIIILKRALVQNDIDDIDRKITDHLNEHNITVNKLIDVNKELVEGVNNLTKIIKHNME